MKIAIFSDIHANLEALDAVLADAMHQGCESFICLGDVVGYNADPGACLDKLSSMKCPLVKGNHDLECAHDTPLENLNPVAKEALEWTRNQLSTEQRRWLSRLPLVCQVQGFTIVHSTLDQPASWNYVTNKFDAMANFSFQVTALCFCGHTHVPKVFTHDAMGVNQLEANSFHIQEGLKYFINTGSVGQPRDGDWRASYVVYNLAEKQIIFRKVEYDAAATQNKIIAAGLPASLAQRLAHGR